MDMTPAPLISLRGIPCSASDSGSDSDSLVASEHDPSSESVSDTQWLMRLASDVVVGNLGLLLDVFFTFL